MDIPGEQDLDTMMRQVQDDASGSATQDVLVRLDRYCEETEALMGRTTDMLEGRQLQAMLDMLKATRDLMPVVWSQMHGRAFPDEVEPQSAA